MWRLERIAWTSCDRWLCNNKEIISPEHQPMGCIHCGLLNQWRGGCSSGGRAGRLLIESLDYRMLKYPWAENWTPQLLLMSCWHLVWQPLPSVYECVCKWVNVTSFGEHFHCNTCVSWYNCEQKKTCYERGKQLNYWLIDLNHLVQT